MTLGTTGACRARCVAAAAAGVAGTKFKLNIEVYDAEIRVYERNEFVDVPEGNLSNNYDENYNIIAFNTQPHNQTAHKKSNTESRIKSTHMWGGSFTTASIISASSSDVNNSLTSHPVLSNIRAMIFFRAAVVAGTLRK